MTQRPIKFRAYDIKEKKWLLGYDTGSLGGFNLFGECMLLGEWSKVIDDYVFERGTHKHGDLKVMQFTGLEDKNGREIYEGDIVEHLEKMFGGDGKKERFEVKFIEGAFVTNSGSLSIVTSSSLFMATVIGNVYENPELLKP